MNVFAPEHVVSDSFVYEVSTVQKDKCLKKKNRLINFQRTKSSLNAQDAKFSLIQDIQKNKKQPTYTPALTAYPFNEIYKWMQLVSQHVLPIPIDSHLLPFWTFVDSVLYSQKRFHSTISTLSRWCCGDSLPTFLLFIPNSPAIAACQHVFNSLLSPILPLLSWTWDATQFWLYHNARIGGHLISHTRR